MFKNEEESAISIIVPSLPDTGHVDINLTIAEADSGHASTLDVYAYADEYNPLQPAPIILAQGRISGKVLACTGGDLKSYADESFQKLEDGSKNTALVNAKARLQGERSRANDPAGEPTDREVQTRAESQTYQEVVFSKTQLEEGDMITYSNQKEVRTHYQRQSVRTSCVIDESALWMHRSPAHSLTVPHIQIVTPVNNSYPVSRSVSVQFYVTSGYQIVHNGRTPNDATNDRLEWVWSESRSASTGAFNYTNNRSVSVRATDGFSMQFESAREVREEQRVVFYGGIALGVLGSYLLWLLPALIDLIPSKKRRGDQAGEPEGS